MAGRPREGGLQPHSQPRLQGAHPASLPEAWLHGVQGKLLLGLLPAPITAILTPQWAGNPGPDGRLAPTKLGATPALSPAERRTKSVCVGWTGLCAPARGTPGAQREGAGPCCRCHLRATRALSKEPGIGMARVGALGHSKQSHTTQVLPVSRELSLHSLRLLCKQSVRTQPWALESAFHR